MSLAETSSPRSPIAGLPMYDWPEVREATDALWARLRAALEARGFAAPAELARERDLFDLWRDPGLLVGQTCGLPLVRHLADTVCVLGAPDHGVAGCPPGHYCSVVVVARESRAESLDDLRGTRLAFNHPGSQSGEGALRHLLAPRAGGRAWFSQVIETGSHRAALAAVASGEAEVATLDAVSFGLAQAHDPATGGVRVLLRTPPTPGLPLITARGNAARVKLLREAVSEAIAAAPRDVREALFLKGFVPMEAADYAVIAERDTAASRLGYPALA
ncbi:phosphate/phosphite/phosphonate ABC transporter substrate-binding protein [Stappia sp. MMSF_3263]|uniref:phosphate/phosphite/phosphonate ABC transporter substrate-binding protein n=1 Tax=Stappia sp. MMSF_3263 TaxID=3046693 RepID=UPI00273D7EAB|nr:PhnD/SsuA/transferrin family substrate-binding protein [Stappia sp. MMSF_3263]